MQAPQPTIESLQDELEETRRQLAEAHDAIEAIRTGQVDALILQTGDEHQLYTLKSADHAYRLFIERMIEGAVTLSGDGIILFANSQFGEMVNTPLSEVIGISFSKFVLDHDLSEFQRAVTTAWTGDSKTELSIRKQGDSIPVQLSLTPLELEEGTLLSVIITDLTEQKAAQQQLSANNQQLEYLNKTLEASNHDLQQFASVASHDLQEPLRKIQLFGNLLQVKAKDKFDADESKYLDKLVGSAGRMKTLIVDVLNYSKLSANDAPFLPTDLNAILEDILEDFELLIQEKQAKVIADHLPTMEVNPGQMRQMLQNLISNSLKFSKKNVPPVINMSLKHLAEKSFDSPEKADGPFCMISVKDNGIGFDQKYVTNVFALFERLHPKDFFEGSGIGLAITKKIVEKHDGLITVKSEVGVGAEFQIILPCNHSFEKL